MKRLLAVLLVAAGALAAAGFWMVPPARRALIERTDLAPIVRGAIHVHTNRSDGTGTVDDVAAAAARAGLAFVIITDHGDGTRQPDAPAYRHGVLCIDAVEVSADGGHVVALGLVNATPYPLGGETRDVVEDIARLGGMSVAAHPGSVDSALRWSDWTTPLDGIEWLNGDSEWRDEAPWTLTATLLTYPFRQAETLGALLDRPVPIMARWDALAANRRVVALAGADAHARIWPPEYGGRNRPTLLNLPSYEQMFRAFSIALPDTVLSRDAARDADSVMKSLREGSVYSSVDALAAPAALRFTARSGSTGARMGDTIPVSGPVGFHVETNAPEDARIVLLKDGKPSATANGASLRYLDVRASGVYRIEVHLPEAPGDPPVPWIVSNPIYVRSAEAAASTPEARSAATEILPVFQDEPAVNAVVESSVRSEGAVDVVPTVGGTQVSLRYALGGTRSESPYVALALPAGQTLAQYDRLMFSARATGPMRLSVQLRAVDGDSIERWHRSVYVDESLREVTVFFDDLRPRGKATRSRPVLEQVRDLLFVVDTVNARPGTSGELRIGDIQYGR
jgi:hypothetical protein